MQLHGNEITVYRGEAFTISKVIINRNSTPYIISNELINPHFLLSITNTLYQQDKRFIKNYWLPIEDCIPTFDVTVPVDIKMLKTDEKGNVPVYNSLDEVSGFPLTGYLNGKLVEINERYAVFYDDDKSYKYWDNGWKNYLLRIIKCIPTDETKTWNVGSYSYSIQLVTGELSSEGGLSKIHNSVPILPPTKMKVNNYAQGGVL